MNPPEPQILDLGFGLRLEALGNYLTVELVDGHRRLSTDVPADAVGPALAYILSRMNAELLGKTKATATALYLLKALLDAAARWRAEAEARRRRLEQQLAEARARASRGEGSPTSMVCYEGWCMPPREAAKRLSRELEEARAMERRLAEAAAALAEAWRALTGGVAGDGEAGEG